MRTEIPEQICGLIKNMKAERTRNHIERERTNALVENSQCICSILM